MHALTLADIAVAIALHGPGLLSGSGRLPLGPIHRMWALNHDRQSAWHAALARYHDLEKLGQQRELRQWWERRRGLIEEILISDVLVRVLAAVGELLEARARDADAGPILELMYQSHQQVRVRALEVLTTARGAPIETVLNLNRVRSIAERWGDLLVGQLATSAPTAAAFACHPERALGFASESKEADPTYRALIRTLVPLAFHDSLHRIVQPEAESHHWNEQIAQAALACLRPDLFDSVGVSQSLWLQRLQTLCEQTEGVVKELLSPALPYSELLESYQAVRDDRSWRRRSG